MNKKKKESRAVKIGKSIKPIILRTSWSKKSSQGIGKCLALK
jgi:hypothetical protein